MVKIELKDVLKNVNLQKLKDKLVEQLKETTPVDTGNARNNWKVTKSGIENETEYLEYLNQGSSKQAPEYFIEKTLLSNRFLKPNGIIVSYK